MNSKMKLAELDTLQMNAEDTNKQDYSELKEMVKIEGTPFMAVRINDKWTLLMGRYRLTEQLDTLEEIQEDAKRSDWDRVLQVMGILIEEWNSTK